MKKIEVNKSGERLDVYLTSELKVTRSFVKKRIDEGKVLVNDIIQKSGYIVKVNDIILFDDKVEEINLTPSYKELEIIYEDEYLAVINKDKNVIVHPSKSYNGETLVNILLGNLKSLSSINGVIRPGIVHRLDKDTSGLLIVAKEDNTHRLLSLMLKDHLIKREYIALIDGHLKYKTGTIELPIKRDDNNRLKMSINKNGKKSTTNYEVIESFLNTDLVKVNLETGRTHQIRVHFSYLGYPVYGDKLYNKDNKLEEGQYLCAHKLEFVHPVTNKNMIFEVPLPKYFLNKLEELRKINN
ncbi:MAG: RluA family pseudouridine synthase [Acholeplasmatales bacterium]|jgi:23S rRNA pseudouridine1911/1915/1917 synthase|nr:RluA family pseudouridine synthase [Acholeplasmatales bacterium]